MIKTNDIATKRVFEIFEEISLIPRGSGDMEKIADFCENFAKKNSLKYIRDEANNVVIFKDATKGYEMSQPIILQGHLDMVCQSEGEFDFLNNGLEIYTDGDFVKARGTTLGADNGIAVSYILSILESNEISHPKIEAVFTTDEEIGLLGATALDKSILTAKKMINLDSEEEDILTVSCAGGSDFAINAPLSFEKVKGTKVKLTLKGLKGGHSGVEIHKGRVNSNILAGRVLNLLENFDLISIAGGNKSNAIPNSSVIEFCVKDANSFIEEAEKHLNIIKSEISAREEDFCFEIETLETDEFNVIERNLRDDIIYLLTTAPNGIVDMSAEIEGLVETSLNLGILKTEGDNLYLHFALRSNKASALLYLEKKLERFSKCIECKTESFGFYPPWEFKDNSSLQALYKKCFREEFGYETKVEAIHAGLECSVFASLEDFDCISIGPSLFDVHTVKEKMSISSAERMYKLLLRILRESK